jgi:cation/acetate symporter
LLTGRSIEATTNFLCLAILIIVGSSGQRSATWTGVAIALAALLALILPVTIVATIETFLPLPQLSHGPVLRALARTEALQAVPQIQLPPLAMTLPGSELTILAGRFGSPTTSLGSWAFCMLSLVVAFGVAGSPSLLLRTGTTPSVYEARKSLGWAAFVLLVVVTTVSAIAVLTRDIVLKQAIGSDPARLVDWLKDWVGIGLAGVDPSGGRIGVSNLAFRRDGVLYLLAHAHGLPHVIVASAVAGAMAAALLAALQTALAMSVSLADDIVLGSRPLAGADRRRLLLARIGLAATLVVAGGIVTRLPADPLQLMLWSLGLTAATAFPVMVLSIWWKSVSSRGALSGALAGFVLTALGMVLSEAGILGLASPLAAVLGVPVAFAAAVAVSLVSPPPSRTELELIRDVRVPGGETYIDREVRHSRTLGRRS